MTIINPLFSDLIITQALMNVNADSSLSPNFV